MFKNLTFSILITLLCSMFISCKEVNEPNIPEEPPVTVEPPIEDPPETFFEGPIVVTGGGGGSGMITDDMRRISNIITESDLVFVGEAHRRTQGVMLSHVEIIETLKGATNEKEALITHPYVSDGEIHIFFIRKEGDAFVFILNYSSLDIINIRTNYYDKEEYEQLDDIKLLLNAYKKNRDLFSKAGKQDLINLFPQLKGFDVIRRVLDDLYFLVDENDVDFLTTGLQSADDNYNVCTLRMLAGRIPKIEELKELIANVLFTTPYMINHINSTKIIYSLEALGKYGDIKYKDIFFEYVNHPIDETIKYAAANAILQIQDLETLLAFVPYYMQQNDREAIINYLNYTQDNNEILLPVLYQLREIEITDRIIKRIDDIIASRTGG